MAKLILTQEVTGLGGSGDIVEVKDGYARNYLLPRGFAMTWTRGSAHEVERLRAARAAREIATIEEAQQIAATLQSATVTIPVKSGQSGRLFGAVGPAQVAQGVEDAGLGSIDKRTVVIPQRIKTVGSYKVKVALHAEVAATVNIQVTAV